MKYFTLKECISSNTAKEKGKNEGKPLVFTFFVRSSQTACGFRVDKADYILKNKKK